MWTWSPATGLEGGGEFDLFPEHSIQVLVHNRNLLGHSWHPFSLV